jgi:parallel beta-helix repeat protein
MRNLNLIVFFGLILSLIFSIQIISSIFIQDLNCIKYSFQDESLDSNLENKIMDYTLHPIIKITHNDNFSELGFLGNGNSDSPYLIDNLNITEHVVGTEPLISITGTTAYFKISNCFLDAEGGGLRDAIYLNTVSHGIIENNTLQNTNYGIEIVSSVNCNITRNTILQMNSDGIEINAGNDLLIIDNTISNCTQYGIEIWNVPYYSQISGNLIFNCTREGIYMYEGRNTNISYNFFLDNNEGGSSQAFDFTEIGATNRWDNGTHGNYYNDYTGLDTNGDGIGESNYTIDGHQYNDTKPLVSNLQIIGPGNLNIEAGTVYYLLIWDISSILIGKDYNFYIAGDSTPINSGTWKTERALNFLIDVSSFSLNSEYEFTLIIKDISGQTESQSARITIVDTTAPEITYTGDYSINFQTGTTGNTISISATDLYPYRYFVYQNGTELTSSTWESGASFDISLDSLAVGTYNYTVVVQDTSGNNASKSVIITVLESDDTSSEAGNFPELLVIIGTLVILSLFTLKRRNK